MTGETVENWGDLGLSSLFRNPFLWPSLAIHLLVLYLALSVTTLPTRQTNTPIPIQLLELREGGSPDKSIGAARGPGGPRTMPKLGSPVPPQQAVAKPDISSTETPTASEEPTPPKAPVLPGPKVLAGSFHADPLAVKETTPDSLVQLPTKGSSGNVPSAAHAETTHKNPAALNDGGDRAGGRALKEGAQIPGALKGTGAGAGPYGVPGGSRAGTGLTGGGTGSGTGGGSSTGLKGISNADYNQYLKQLERRVNSVWRYPDGVSGVQKVTVRFTLDRAGKLSQAEVLESSDSRINASALEAMKRASPFPPIPETLKDLAGEPLIIRFTVAIRLRG